MTSRKKKCQQQLEIEICLPFREAVDRIESFSTESKLSFRTHEIFDYAAAPYSERENNGTKALKRSCHNNVRHTLYKERIAFYSQYEKRLKSAEKLLLSKYENGLLNVANNIAVSHTANNFF